MQWYLSKVQLDMVTWGWKVPSSPDTLACKRP